MKVYILLLSCLIFSISNLFSQNIEAEINKFAGSFSGEWTTFKLNNEQEVIKSISWKDTLKTDDPIINDSLAYVNINSKMVFDNPRIPVYNMKFIEGFKIEKGEIKSHFFTMMGAEITETKIGENTYIISQEISSYDMKQLGILGDAKGTNTTVKVIMIENEIEVHKITRLSTIKMMEDSKEKTIQFVSLQGYHKRIKN